MSARLSLAALTMSLAFPSLSSASLPVEDLGAGQPSQGQITSGKAEPIAGRLSGRKAALLNRAQASWPLPSLAQVSENASPLLIEFWVQPGSWTGAGEQEVTLATIETKDGSLISIKKSEATPEIVLSINGAAVSRYPAYRWGEAFWKQGAGSREWHQVILELNGDKSTWTIDGFSAGTFSLPETKEEARLVLGDSAHSSAYADLVISHGSLPTGAALRRQFRISYNREPELPPALVTAPYLEGIESASVDPAALADWLAAHGTELPSFVSTRGRGLLAEPIKAYIAYDAKALYLSLSMPYTGQLDARDWGSHDAPLDGEESFEIFLHPPLTGVADYVQLMGNPFGNRADLRVFDKSWNGDWQWTANRSEGRWSALLVVPFEGVSLPNPGESADWTMNIFNTNARASWAWNEGAYHNTDLFGQLRFRKGAAIVRTALPEIGESRVNVPVRIVGGASGKPIKATLAYFPEGAVFPLKTAEEERTLAKGKEADFNLLLEGLQEGMASLTITEGDDVIHSQSFRIATSEKQVRTSKETPLITSAANASDDAPKWSAEQLGQSIIEAQQWKGNKLGISDTPPKPWTPIKIEEDALHTWGRSYQYGESLFLSAIRTSGKELLAAPIRLVVGEGKKQTTLEKGASRIVSQTDSIAVLESAVSAGALSARVTSEVEFDGMAKISLELSSSKPDETYDALYLEIPITAAFAENFHYTASYSGHPPETDSGAIPKEGFTLNRLREIVWIGNMEGGLCWFTEGMENWPLWDENALITLSPEKDGRRTLRIKLGDRPFRLAKPLRITFGLQATPTRPRDPRFRQLSDRQSYVMPWYRGDGHYVPWHDQPEPSRKDILAKRSEGIEIMPVSSLRYYGKYYFDHNAFYSLPHKGMIRPEVYLWGKLWEMTRHKGDVQLPDYETKQVARSGWEGKQFRPADLVDCCPHSSFQDFYIWKLDRLIKETEVGAWYLDQPLVRCSNPLHGCGYTDYKGEWAASTPIFSMRSMLKRIHRLFYDQHGKTHIRWHSSNHIIVPCISFADVNWDGENYLYGPLRVGEFYSEKLPLARLRTQHTGVPFGYAHDLLPEFGSLEVARRNAPSPDSVRDMMGLFMVHDSTAAAMWTAHNDLVRHIQDKRLSFPFADGRPIYYWDNDPRIVLNDAPGVLSIAHPGDSEWLLVLFNPGNEPLVPTVVLDYGKLGLPEGGKVSCADLESGNALPVNDKGITVPLAPHDFRMLRIRSH